MNPSMCIHHRLTSGRVLFAMTLAGLVTAYAVPSTQAQIETITSPSTNSSVTFNLGTSANAYDWDVFAQDQLKQMAFWYRIGNVGPELPVNTISVPTYANLGDVLTVSYATPQFEIRFTYQIADATFTSDLTVTVEIEKLSEGNLDFTLFQYSDFDLNESPTTDSVIIHGVPNNTATQSGLAASLTESVVVPQPTNYQAALFAGPSNPILTMLTNGTPDILSNFAGPTAVGDAVWAFQWGFTLTDFFPIEIINKDMLLTIPEPSTMALAILGSLLMIYPTRQRTPRA